jgi:hypothetical protein
LRSVTQANKAVSPSGGSGGFCSQRFLAAAGLPWTLGLFDRFSFPMRWMIRIAAVVAFTAVLAGGFFVYHGISASLHAEHVLHAALLTVQLLDDYVTTHDGQWPRSWADLETLPPREWAMFEWPKDSPEVQRYVAVDFSADPQRLAVQSVDEFDAVRPIGPYYPFKDRGTVEALLKSIRERKSDR